MVVEFGHQSGLENRVDLALRRHAWTDRFLHQLTLQEIGAVVLRLGLFISGFLISVFRHFGFIGVLNAGFFSIPFGRPAHLDFSAGAQIGMTLGELFGIRIELRDNIGLAGFHFG